MKHIALITALILLPITACDENTPAKPFVPAPATPPSGTLPPGHPPINSTNQGMSPPESSKGEMTQQATVVSTIDIPQFTYIEIKQNDKTRWLASKTISTKKGDVIRFDHGETVSNFSSKTLMRTFSSITFVNEASVIKK